MHVQNYSRDAGSKNSAYPKPTDFQWNKLVLHMTVCTNQLPLFFFLLFS